jgi:hypothetical protein
MPGVSGNGDIAVRNPALALILALFILGYILWTTDHLAALSRRRTAAAGLGTGRDGLRAAASQRPALARPQTVVTASAGRADAAALALRFAACYESGEPQTCGLDRLADDALARRAVKNASGSASPAGGADGGRGPRPPSGRSERGWRNSSAVADAGSRVRGG